MGNAPKNIVKNPKSLPREATGSRDAGGSDHQLSTAKNPRLYLSPLEGAKPPREGDRHSPYYANMRLEFIN